MTSSIRSVRSLRPLSGRRLWRPARRDRATGYAALGVVAVLVAAAALLGTGAGASIPRLADIGGWLPDSGNGTAVHVNGLTGGVDGWVRLDSSGHPVKISQGPDGVLVVDQSTGLISRIDTAQLTVAQTQDFGQAGLEVFDDGQAAYLVAADTGSVSLIDPSTLSVKGPALRLPAPLGHPGLDASGTLWAPLANGSVVPVTAGAGAATPAAGAPVEVGAANDPLALTIADGVPIVTDAHDGAVTVLSASGGRLSVRLPPAATGPAGGRLLAPDTADSAVVPVLAAGDGTLVLVDTAHGALSAVHVDAGDDRLDAPQTLAGKVYIPDDTRGTLIVYDTVSGAFLTQITVTGHAGQLEAQVRDGLLWVNDQAGEQALVIGQDGVPHAVDKAAPGGPAASASGGQSAPTQGPDSSATGSASPGRSHASGPVSSTQSTSDAGAPSEPPSAVSAPDQSSTTQSATHPSKPSTPPTPPTATSTVSTTPPTSPPTTSSPTPPPSAAPGTPTATSGPGRITVTFPPAGNGAVPTGYVLHGAPPGATVTPAQVPSKGPYSFTVTGGTCASTYSFTVQALYPSGPKTSPASVAVRPCTAPAPPTGLRGTAVDHGARLTWNAAGGNGATPSYSVTGPGTIRVSGTTATVSRLADFTTATFKLTATTPAGTSNPAVTVQVPITGPTYDATAWNDSAGSFYVRDGPNTLHQPIGSFPKGSTAQIVVICQDANGETIWDRTVWSGSSTIWDKVQYQGRTAYIAGLYVSTPNVVAKHYTSPDSPKIWPCT